MAFRDFIVLMLCCLFWGANFVVGAWAVNEQSIPPIMLAAVRAAIVLVLTFPFLFRKRPQHFKRLLWVCLCVGPLHLAFLYTGLGTAPASASSIVAQMMIPFATILSVIFLKERIGWVRSTGIISALIGVVVIIYEPDALSLDIGLLYVMAAYLFLAIGSILMKRVGSIDWQIYVAWMAVTVLITMTIGSAIFETGQIQVAAQKPWELLLACAYAAVAVSIIAHGQYFRLIQNYEVSVIVPLTLMTPFFATLLGVGLRGETLSLKFILGAALILGSVYIIARRQNIPAVAED